LSAQLTKSYSSLLQIIVRTSPLVNESESESPVVGLNPKGLERLARLAFTQLTELRHRGAFSAIAHAFTACCLRCRHSGRADILDVLYDVSQLLYVREPQMLTDFRTHWLASDFKDRRSQDGLPEFPPLSSAYYQRIPKAHYSIELWLISKLKLKQLLHTMSHSAILYLRFMLSIAYERFSSIPFSEPRRSDILQHAYT